MTPHTHRCLLATVIGMLVTGILYGLGAVAYDSGHERLSRMLYWQGPALQGLSPGLTVGTADNPIVEATPLHVVLFFAGLPVGAVLYSLLVFGGLHLVRRRVG